MIFTHFKVAGLSNKQRGKLKKKKRKKEEEDEQEQADVKKEKKNVKNVHADLKRRHQNDEILGRFLSGQIVANTELQNKQDLPTV